MLVTLTPAIRKLEDGDFPAAGLSVIWDTIFVTLYLAYDMEQEFLPQFRVTAENLIKLGKNHHGKIPIPSFEAEDQPVDADGADAKEGV